MMHTAVLLHLSVASAALNPNQLRASPGLFSELPKEPFDLQQKENPSMLLQEAAGPAAPFPLGTVLPQ